MVGPRAHTRTHTHTHTHTHTLRHLLVKSSFKSRDIAGCFLRVRHPLHVRTTNQVVHVGQWSERLDSPGPVGNDCTLGGCCFNDSIMQNVLHGGRGGGQHPACLQGIQPRRGGGEGGVTAVPCKSKDSSSCLGERHPHVYTNTYVHMERNIHKYMHTYMHAAHTYIYIYT